jgi:uncharacterized protein YutD
MIYERIIFVNYAIQDGTEYICRPQYCWGRHLVDWLILTSWLKTRTNGVGRHGSELYVTELCNYALAYIVMNDVVQYRSTHKGR